MTLPRITHRREGFTLVELLTVIGIISLLISILLPSLSKARDQAKKVRVQAQISAVEKGLEMFQNDFNQYPDSSLGADPVKWSVTWPASNPLTQPPENALLTGAHWLARAMIGHDFQGIDTGGTMLKRPPNPVGTWVAPTLDSYLSSTTPPGVNSERRGMYLDPQIFVRDDDAIKFPGVSPGTGPVAGRIVVLDGYNSPILYYRANPRAAFPFDVGTYGSGVASSKGTYTQLDNALWTGANGANGGATYASYDFAAAGSSHGLRDFGAATINDYMTNLPLLDANAGATGTQPDPPYKGKSFINFFHSESTHQAGNAAKPVNPERFVLISAGKDGVFGTQDDVTNFGAGGL